MQWIDSDKDAKPTQRAEESFYQPALGKLDIHVQKKEFRPLSQTTHKISSKVTKWIIDWNVRVKTIKPLDKDIGENFCDLGSDEDFLDIISKA